MNLLLFKVPLMSANSHCFSSFTAHNNLSMKLIFAYSDMKNKVKSRTKSLGTASDSVSLKRGKEEK